jgi:hypothetical protein
MLQQLHNTLPGVFRIAVLTSFLSVFVLNTSLYSAALVKDTIFIYVIKPVISAPHLFSKDENEKLDGFCKNFKMCFAEVFQVESGNRCATYYQVIDLENEAEAKRIKDQSHPSLRMRVADVYFRGELSRETDGYILHLNLKNYNNTIIASEHAGIRYSEADDYSKAKATADKISGNLIEKLCDTGCKPKILEVYYTTNKNRYYQKITQVLPLILSYSPSMDNADEMDERVAELIEDLQIGQDELFLSYSIANGLFWKKVRENTSRAQFFFQGAQDYYCNHVTSNLDIELLLQYFKFDDFNEFIQNQIQSCKPR